MGMARAAAGRLSDHPDHFLAPPFARGNRRVPAYGAPPAAHIRSSSPRRRKLETDSRGHDARRVHDDLLLPDHRVHADVREAGAASRTVEDLRRYALRRAFEFHLAADRRSGFGSHWQAAISDPRTRADDPHCVSGNALARRRAESRQAARRGTLVLVPIRRLQRRDDSVSHGDHARRGAHRRVFTCVQSRDSGVRRLHAGDRDVFDRAHWEQGFAGDLALARRRSEPSRRDHVAARR